MSNGASPAIKVMMEVLLRNDKDGVMFSTPQYPIYSGLLRLLNGAAVPYLLDEEDSWNVSLDSLVESHK